MHLNVTQLLEHAAGVQIEENSLIQMGQMWENDPTESHSSEIALDVISDLTVISNLLVMQGLVFMAALYQMVMMEENAVNPLPFYSYW